MPFKGKWFTMSVLAAAAACAAVSAGFNSSATEPPVSNAAPATDARPSVTERSQIIRNIQASSVKIILGREDAKGAVSDEQSSSGVVIYAENKPRPWSLVLTNAHAVKGHDTGPDPLGVYVTYVTTSGRRILPGKVLAEGDIQSVDLALVRVGGISLPAARFEPMEEVQLGSPILVASSPFGRELSITSGIISQLYLSGPPALDPVCATDTPREHCLDPKPLEEIFKTDAPICYGSSGGGVFLTSSGRLVGLVESYQSADLIIRPKPGEQYKIQIPVPGESFLISANKIKYFLGQHGFVLKDADVLLTSSGAS
ncbi:MAG: serine protease [Pseudomonadota bacterium]